MTQERDNRPTEDVLDLLRGAVTRRSLLITLGSAAIAAVAGGVGESQRGPSYQVTSRLKIEPGSININPVNQPVLTGGSVDDYREIFGGYSMTIKVAQNLGYDIDEKSAQAAKQLPFTVEVKRQKAGQLIDVVVTSSDPELALKAANEFINVAKITTQERQNERFQEARQKMEAQIAQLQTRINNLGSQEQGGNELRVLQEAETQLQTELTRSYLVQAPTADRISVIEPPRMPESNLGSRLPKTAGAVGLGGLVFGATVVLLERYFDRRIRSPEEAEQLLGLPILARIYRATTNQDGSVWSQSGANAPFFQELRQRVINFDPDNPRQIIAITSSNAKEGKSAVALGLAASLSAMEKKWW